MRGRPGSADGHDRHAGRPGRDGEGAHRTLRRCLGHRRRPPAQCRGAGGHADHRRSWWRWPTIRASSGSANAGSTTSMTRPRARRSRKASGGISGPRGDRPAGMHPCATGGRGHPGDPARGDAVPAAPFPSCCIASPPAPSWPGARWQWADIVALRHPDLPEIPEIRAIAAEDRPTGSWSRPTAPTSRPCRCAASAASPAMSRIPPRCWRRPGVWARPRSRR